MRDIIEIFKTLVKVILITLFLPLVLVVLLGFISFVLVAVLGCWIIVFKFKLFGIILIILLAIGIFAIVDSFFN